MTPGAGVGQDIETYRLGQRLDNLNKQAPRFDRFSKERVAIEDERTKVWSQFRNRIQTRLGAQSTTEVLKEYKDPQIRLKAVQKVDIDRALKMIFQWSRMGQIEYNEFEELVAEFVAKVHKHI